MVSRSTLKFSSQYVSVPSVHIIYLTSHFQTSSYIIPISLKTFQFHYCQNHVHFNISTHTRPQTTSYSTCRLTDSSRPIHTSVDRQCYTPRTCGTTDQCAYHQADLHTLARHSEIVVAHRTHVQMLYSFCHNTSLLQMENTPYFTSSLHKMTK